jgi:FKBP-type peptidyl-prolyl cis-trans isomerase
VQELISANSASYIMAYSRGDVIQEGTLLILRRPVGPNAAAALKTLQERRAAERAPRSKAEMRAEASRKEAAAREAKTAEAKAAKEAKEAAAAEVKVLPYQLARDQMAGCHRHRCRCRCH